MTLASQNGTRLAHRIFNTSHDPQVFELPGPNWHRIIDTNLAPSGDYVDPANARSLPGMTYLAAPRSVVVLVAD